MMAFVDAKVPYVDLCMLHGNLQVEQQMLSVLMYVWERIYGPSYRYLFFPNRGELITLIMK